jgi:hypothetical protein
VKPLKAAAMRETFTGNSQHGLSSFGMLIILAIAAAAGYYAYKGITGPGDDAPSCKETFRACMTTCRRTTTEAPAAQACQQSCQRDADACGRG